MKESGMIKVYLETLPEVPYWANTWIRDPLGTPVTMILVMAQTMQKIQYRKI